MGGVDPLAAFAAGGGDLAALIDTELAQLAADAQALGALLVEGVVVNARVLPSNGLTDLLEIAGRRVAASLPTTLRPGDVVQVRVTGFDNGRILLQIVATGADASAEPGTPLAPAAPPVSGGENAPAPPSAPQAASPSSMSLDELPPPAVSPTRPGITAAFTSAISRANIAPSQGGGPPRNQTVIAGEPSSIEARVAASRATVPQAGVPFAAPEPLGAAAIRPVQPFVAPPQIAPKSASPNAVQALPSTGAPLARATGLAVYAQPVALLRALRLPVTPSTVASATLALQRPDRLPAALAALEAALPAVSGDAHVATLRTLLAFVGRIDPRSPALAAQIAAFVEHVVDGSEPKLATLLAATREASYVSPAADGQSSAAARQAPDAPTLPAAVVAERSVALSADLKQTLLAVAADPATPESLGPSLAGALTALTAVQVHAAQALAAQPDGLAFSIPLTTQHGAANAQITVKRDAPQGSGAKVDGENFHIAFVLDTANYGTVAIDLVTVGREVTVDVRTSSAPAMRAFRDALGTLTGRLESLRYRVAAAGASLGTTSTIAVEAPPGAPSDPDATVDRSA